MMLCVKFRYGCPSDSEEDVKNVKYLRTERRTVELNMIYAYNLKVDWGLEGGLCFSPNQSLI